MRNRGGFLTASPPTFTSTSAGGIFKVNDAAILRAANQYPRGPAAPTGFTAEPGNAQLSLSWTAPATTYGTITNYLVEYTPSGGSAAYVLTNSTGTSYTLTGLTNGTLYTVRVAAVNFTAGDWSGAVTVTPNNVVAPSAPQNLTVQQYVTLTGGLGARLSWSAPSNTGGGTVTGYRIVSSGDFVAVNSVISGTTIDVAHNRCGGDGSISVRAINSAGEGAEATTGTLGWNYCD
jgi:hypothetical protein